MRRLVGFVLFALVAAGCGSDSADVPVQQDVTAAECIVRLHGKGGDGAATEFAGSVAIVSPRGNGEAWGGHQWEYATADALADAVTLVTDELNPVGCGAIAVHGFSNGASFAAKLACSGEDFAGRLRGVVVDDPVTDLSSADCALAAGVELTLYWTDALTATAPAGTDCGRIDWTCEGGSTIGIDAYAAALGTAIQASPHEDHRWFLDAPEPWAWLIHE